MATRVAELGSLGVKTQMISPVPVVLHLVEKTTEVAGYLRSMNEGIAAAVAGAQDRLVGLGAVPTQSGDLAVAELQHVSRELGLVGVEIGCRFGQLELEAPELSPFFAEADALGMLVFVYPREGGQGTVRRLGQPTTSVSGCGPTRVWP